MRFAVLMLSLFLAAPALAAGKGEEYCKTIGPDSAKPNYIVQGSCIIQRTDMADNAHLCRMGLMGDQLPAPSSNLQTNITAGALPVCYKFCYFEDNYIEANPPPWPVTSEHGVRPTWKNKLRVNCPRDPATGAWTLSAAKKMPRRAVCEQRKTKADGQCTKACKIYETRTGLVNGINYGAKAQDVLIQTTNRNVTIGQDGAVKSIPNPAFACKQ